MRNMRDKRRNSQLPRLSQRNRMIQQEYTTRKIPLSCVSNGSIVAKSIEFGESILLRKGSIFQKNHIPELRNFGVDYIYIADALSREISNMEMISNKLKETAQRAIETIFTNPNSRDLGNGKQIDSVNKAKKLVQEIISEIISRKNCLLNGVDIKSFDSHTFEHSVNVAVLSLLMGIRKKYEKKQLYNLGVAAFFHDIGKIFIPEDILNKKDQLTDKEFDLIKEHPQLGFEYLKEHYLLEFNGFIRMGIKDHHEKVDGTGYPKGKKGNEISEIARIIAVADVYDSLTSEKPYRKAMLPSEAFEVIMSMANSHLDFEFVSIFQDCIALYPIGTGVKLSNKVVGIVVDNFPGFGDRPLIRDLEFKEHNLLTDTSLRSVVISEVVDIKATYSSRTESIM